MMRDGIDHYFFTTTHLNMVLIGIFSRVVWLFPIYSSYDLVLTNPSSSPGDSQEPHLWSQPKILKSLRGHPHHESRISQVPALHPLYDKETNRRKATQHDELCSEFIPVSQPSR